MVLKVFFLLATLALVSLPTCSATVQQQQQQQAEQKCVSKADFAYVVQRIDAIENAHSTWRNATLNILRRYLPDNPALLLEAIPGKLGNVQDKLENMQYKMEQQQDKTNRLLDELETLQNTTTDALTDLQHQIKQQQNKTDRTITVLETTMDGQANLRDRVDMLQDKVINLEDKLDTFQNTTEASTRKYHHEVVELLQNTSSSLYGQANLQEKVDTLQDKVINMDDKLDTFQNTTEASTRKNHHEVVELLQNTSCSLYGSEELKQLENITRGLQDQLQSCNGTDISIQYLPTSCGEIAELNPHSSPGYYKISTASGSSATVYCYMTAQDNLPHSCQDIATQTMATTSGYYSVKNFNGTAVQVYCDMERQCCGSTGGWMRAAYLNMTDPTHHCPTGFRLTSHSKRSCERITRPGCTSLTFAVHSIKYSKVCGKVIGYQYGSPDGFRPYHKNRALTLDGSYVEGVSITHGHPRRHIWTFSAVPDEQYANANTCPCTKTTTTYTGIVPPFLGNDYFCDTGSRDSFQRRFYPDDPLWDGRGCGSTSSCCSFNSPPWFCKELLQPTTDDIEVRVCTDFAPSNEDITIEAIELYIW